MSYHHVKKPMVRMLSGSLGVDDDVTVHGDIDVLVEQLRREGVDVDAIRRERAHYARLTKVGFWYSLDEPHFPKPQDHVDRSWDPHERVVVLAYVKNGRRGECYRGMSTCRICGIWNNGSCDLTDGIYLWPEGFAHYIEKHDVKPSAEFVAHVMRQQGGR